MTPLALRVLDMVRDRVTEAGYSPTIAEIAGEFGLSPSRAGDIVNGLVRKGKLVKARGEQRNLRPADAPDLSTVGTGALRAELARRGHSLEALVRKPMPVFAGRKCAATYCQDRVTPGNLMCRDHWLSLPKSLRDRIFRTFRAKDEDAYGEAVREAIELTEIKQVERA